VLRNKPKKLSRPLLPKELSTNLHPSVALPVPHAFLPSIPEVLRHLVPSVISAIGYLILGFTNNASALTEADFVREAILDLLRDNRVEEIISPPDIVNLLTVSVQANGKKRLILDLRHINLHVYKQKFKCKTTFAKDFFVFAFDLKSGYHHVYIFPEHRKYLAFLWEFVSGQTRFFPVYCFAFWAFQCSLYFHQVASAFGDTLEGARHSNSHIF